MMDKYADKIRGDRVEKVMKEEGYTQAALGERIGLSQGAINNVISGVKQLSIPKFIELCRKTRRSADYFLGLTDNEAPVDAAPNTLVISLKTPQEAGIVRDIVECVEQFPLADQLFTLALIKKINANLTPGRTPEAVEAGAVIDLLPAPARAAALSSVYQISVDLAQKSKETEDKLAYLAEVARTQGIDVDSLIAERFGVLLPEKE